MELRQQQKARCEHCGNIQYFREPRLYSGLVALDEIALCCKRPSYWAVDEHNQIKR